MTVLITTLVAVAAGTVMATSTWTAFGDSPEFVKACHGCHTLVKVRDFVWTNYPKR